MTADPIQHRKLRLLAAQLAAAALLAACGQAANPSQTGQPTGTPASSAAEQSPAQASPTLEPSASVASQQVLVALGDSIPFNSPGDCPGCTGFMDAYGTALGTQLGGPVKVVNLSRHDGARTIDILTQLQTQAATATVVGTADVIVISVSFNDQPPFVDPHPGCPLPLAGSATETEVLQAVAATSHACIDTVVPFVRAQVSQAFALMRQAAPHAAIGVLTPYDTWRGWSAVDQLDATTRAAVYDAETYWFHTWNPVLCMEADAIDAVCVDVYGAFNGADGTQPPGDYVVASDYTHPSQKGNDTIRDLLIAASLPDHAP